MLLEVHQPVRHLQVRDVVDRAGVLERTGIFAVRIDHHDMALRRELADAVEDQRGGGRLAGTGRAEQREMLAEHRIDIERGADILGRIDIADLDMGAIVGGVDLLEIGGRHREHRAPGVG